MHPENEERRTSARLSGVVDDALHLAAACGWRYAILFLVREQVPASVVQRLLAGNGKVRKRAITPNMQIREWHKSNSGELESLFEWLRHRRSLQKHDDSRLSRDELADID